MCESDNEYYDEEDFFEGDDFENDEVPDYLNDDMEQSEDVDFDAEENSKLEEDEYDGTFSSYPYVKESTNLTKEERQQAYAEILDIIKNPNSTNAQIDDAKSKAVCYMYALIKNLIKKYCSSFVNPDNYEDFVSIGMMAVLKTLPDYQPSQSSPSTYFYEHIKHDLVVAVSEARGTTRHYNSKVTKVNKARNELIKAGKAPTEAMIAMMTNEPVLTVKRVIETINNQYTKPIDDLRNVQGRTLTPDEEYLEKEKKETVNIALDYLLNDKQREIIKLRYGFENNSPMNLSAIAKQLGITKDEVKKSVTESLKILKLGKIPSSNVINMTKEEKRIFEAEQNQDIQEFTLGECFPELVPHYEKENRYSQNQMYFDEKKESDELSALMTESFDEE